MVHAAAASMAKPNPTITAIAVEVHMHVRTREFWILATCRIRFPFIGVRGHCEQCRLRNANGDFRSNHLVDMLSKEESYLEVCNRIAIPAPSSKMKFRTSAVRRSSHENSLGKSDPHPQPRSTFATSRYRIHTVNTVMTNAVMIRVVGNAMRIMTSAPSTISPIISARSAV